MKVLFVQKEPMLAAALKLTLHKEGYEVVFCTNTLQALTLIKDVNPDLIIADIMLSSNRVEVINQAKNKKIPVIVLSGSGNENQLQQAFDLEADDYATLPLSLTELSLRISRLTHVRATA